MITSLFFVCPLGPGPVARGCVCADILPTAGGLCYVGGPEGAGSG